MSRSSIFGALLVGVAIGAGARPASAQEGAHAEAVEAAPPGTSVAVQVGVSGLTETIEGEVATRWGIVAGAGVHASDYAPVGPTARLAYDHGFGHLRHHHLRLGVRAYPFHESTGTSECMCTFIVPELGYRFTADSGFVFEAGEPLARFNLTRARREGASEGFAVDGDNALLFSVLIGFRYQL
jgi:hypothetical protein